MNNDLPSRLCKYKWHAVYTRSRTEKKAYRELLLKGIESYLPLKTVRRRWGKQSRVIEEPLIRGYVFVRVSYREYYEALFTSGVLRYVCFEGKPAVITDDQVESLKRLMENKENDIQVTSEKIRKGDNIKVVSGPLKNFHAEVVDMRGKYRILLRLENLGCCVHVEIGTNKVITVPSKEEPVC
ncbi:MAG: UpxY family transcription antiterminator [Mangrovibacterium sp.]|jgi:transcription antitermination factor NusG